MTGQIASLTETLAVVLDELRSLRDPVTTALRIDAVTGEADRRLIEQQRGEADSAACDKRAPDRGGPGRC